ncbi:hypothetical protein J3R83DRAFT_10986 [Lanmaoa asiatica]|nr:hypothetical protein J3R83DRAFT_10986 [Lanmaoa asiatica]
MPDEPIFENEPDFEGPNFACERQDLINAGLTPALAITSLQTIFHSNKRKEQADQERERAEAQIAREEEAEHADQLCLQQEEDEEQALKEERKKTKLNSPSSPTLQYQ